jgi:hypothetical protein
MRQRIEIEKQAIALLLGLVLVAFSVLYLGRTQTVVNGYDPLGYLVAGQRLATGGGLSFPDANNAIAGSYFAPFAFNILRPGSTDLYLNYPPGFPILLAVALRILPAASTPFYVTPLLGLCGILIAFWLGKQLFGTAAGLLGAILLGLCPLYFSLSTDLWSDLPATVLALAAILVFVSAAAAGGRHVLLKAATAGLLLGCGVLMRYSAVFIAPAIVVYGASLPMPPGTRRRLLLGLCVGLGTALVGVLVFNKIYFGGSLTTAYSSGAGGYPWPAFSPKYALGSSPVGGRSLIEGLKTLLVELPLVVPLALVGLLRMRRAVGLLLAVGTLAVLGFYGFYAFAPTGINARFLLPVVPLMCLAAASGIEGLRGGLGRRSKLLGALAPLVAISVSIFLFRPALAATSQQARDTVARIQYVRKMTDATPANAVFMSYVYNDLISFYGQRSVLNYRRIPPADAEMGRYRMEILEPCLVAVVGRLLQAQIPVYYVEDQSPPFWDSLALLQRHFVLRQTQSDPIVYQVTSMLDGSTPGDLISCRR